MAKLGSRDNSAKSLPRAHLLIGGQWRDAANYYQVKDPYRREVIGEAPQADLSDLDDAIRAAATARPAAAAVPGYKRAEMLRRVGSLLQQRADDIATTMAKETGKAIKDANAEVLRSLDTISLSAEEAIRIEGEHVPLDGSEMGAGKLAILMRFPVGVVGAITPFNAPVNLMCHKLAPAIAAGNTVVLKPPPQAPLTVHKAVEVFVDAGLPSGFINVVYGGRNIGQALVRDPRVDFVSFTGSTHAGRDIAASIGLRRAALELGGNGPTIVHLDADVSAAAAACARSATRLAGQSCLSVQNIFVHSGVKDRFVEEMATHLRKLRVGDPLEQTTDVGTLIDEEAAKRVELWVNEAVVAGAQIVTGGQRNVAQMQPTLLVNVKPDMTIVCEEVFGPIASVISYENIAEAFEFVSASKYALHCGLFTRSNEITFRAIREIRTGGLIVNGTCTWRTDQLAYGGIRASGVGREGPRYAIREMTDQKLVVFNL